MGEDHRGPQPHRLRRAGPGAPAPAWMSPAEQANTLHRLVALAARVEELTLRVLAAADAADVGAATGHPSS